MRWLLAAWYLLAPPAAASQPATADVDSARKALWSRALVPPRTVMLGLRDRRTITGRIADRRPDSLILWQDRGLEPVDLNDIVAAWIRQSASGRRAAAGGLLGALVLGTVGGVAASIEVQEGASSDTYLTGIVGGALVGGLIGAAIGAVAGSFEVEWCPVNLPDPGLARPVRRSRQRHGLCPDFGERAE